jgi:ubiquinone/menaquinone biosynthesis C-methylase UbiE
MTSLEIYNPRMTYNTAAIDYDTTSVDFWRYAAVETVQRLGLVPGGSLLDVACGPGPAALAAAERVGSHGSVLGVDIAEEMIALAREHAAEAPAPQAEFVVGSMDDLDVGADRFDAATCVFGIFFARDVRASIAEMAGAVRPGGQVAVTSLGPKFFSPLYEKFIEAALAEHPGLDVDVPWHRTEDPEVMRAHLQAAGLEQVEVVHEVSALPLQTPQDWWRIATGTGIRRLIMELEPSAADRVREQNLAWITDQGIDHVELGVIYCTGEVAES